MHSAGSSPALPNQCGTRVENSATSPAPKHNFLTRDGIAPSELVRIGRHCPYCHGWEVVRGLRIVDDQLVGADMHDGVPVSLDVLAVQSTLRQRADYLRPIGLLPEPIEIHGVLVGERIPSEQPGGATSVPGVHVAGNTTDVMAQVVGAASSGMLVGAFVNAQLVEEDATRALAG